MVHYVKALLPRLQQFSKSLDHLETFVEKPWVYIDEEGRRHIYIFQRDKSLIMSLNGQVQIGRWDYIAPASSLLIDRITDKILLNHGFIDKGVMVLRTDGSLDKPWMLINEQEIPDLDVEKYLKQSFIRNFGLRFMDVEGRRYYYSDPNNVGIYSRTEFYDENLEKVSFKFKLNGNQNYEVQDGILKRYFVSLQLRTDKGLVDTISMGEVLTVGDSISIQGLQAPDGFYRLLEHNALKGFAAKNGKVESIKEKANSGLVIYGIAFVSLILIAALASVFSKKDTANDYPPSTETTTTITEPLVTDTTSVYAPEPTPEVVTVQNDRYTAPIEEPVSYKQDYFSIGSTIDEVIEVQGQPTSIMGSDNYKIYSYGLSSVTFSYGKVSGYSDNGNLKIKVGSNSSSWDTLSYFTIGSSIDEVIAVQGQPTSIMGSDNYKIYSYGLSSVTFTNGSVSGYSNNGNLKIKL